MNRLQQWLASHSITAKTAVTAWLFIDGMYYGMPEFHSYVTSVYDHLPKGIHAFAAGVVVPGLIFWQTGKRATLIAGDAPVGPEDKA